MRVQPCARSCPPPGSTLGHAWPVPSPPKPQDRRTGVALRDTDWATPAHGRRRNHFRSRLKVSVRRAWRTRRASPARGARPPQSLPARDLGSAPPHSEKLQHGTIEVQCSPYTVSLNARKRPSRKTGNTGAVRKVSRFCSARGPAGPAVSGCLSIKVSGETLLPRSTGLLAGRARRTVAASAADMRPGSRAPCWPAGRAQLLRIGRGDWPAGHSAPGPCSLHMLRRCIWVTGPLFPEPLSRVSPWGAAGNCLLRPGARTCRRPRRPRGLQPTRPGQAVPSTGSGHVHGRPGSTP